MLRQVIQVLDYNGDGAVTLADVETAVARLCVNIEAQWGNVEEALRGPWCKAGVGLFMLFYGGHFKATAIVVWSLRSSTIAVFRAQVIEIMDEYGRVREGMQANSTNQPEMDTANSSEVLRLAQASVESRPLIAGLQRLSSAMLAQVALALNQSTMSFAVGIQFSRRLADMSGCAMSRLVLGTREAQATEAEKRQVRILTEVTCTAASLASAYLLRGWAALWNTCQTGAQLCFDAAAVAMDLGPDLAQERIALVVTSLGVAGFVYQAQHWGKPPVPTILAPFLFPLKSMEMVVTSIA